MTATVPVHADRFYKWFAATVMVQLPRKGRYWANGRDCYMAASCIVFAVPGNAA